MDDDSRSRREARSNVGIKKKRDDEDYHCDDDYCDADRHDY